MKKYITLSLMVFASAIVAKASANTYASILGAYNNEPSSVDITKEDADIHYIEFLKGNESDVNGDKFWSIGDPKTEYAIYDLNGDGVNELLIRSLGHWIFDIIEYREDKIQYANAENFGSSGVTFINDKNQFVIGDIYHSGRKIYSISEINDQGESHIVLTFMKHFEKYDESKMPEFYKVLNPSNDYLENINEACSITEAEYNALVDEYTKENTSIKWIRPGW